VTVSDTRGNETSGIHKMQGISGLAEEMLGLQGVCYKVLLTMGDIAWRLRFG
jgi:hypothetical protein